MNPRICVYCGASNGKKQVYRQAAAELGTIIATRGCSLIYGGGSVGLMGAVADAVIAGKGTVNGIIPKHLARPELAHRGITQLDIVDTMHHRKWLMAVRADLFIALPGGIGTLDELSEILTWAQLGIHTKPFGMLNINGYFDHLLSYLDHAVAEGFFDPLTRKSIVIEPEPHCLFERLIAILPPRTTTGGKNVS